MCGLYIGFENKDNEGKERKGDLRFIQCELHVGFIV